MQIRVRVGGVLGGRGHDVVELLYQRIFILFYGRYLVNLLALRAFVLLALRAPALLVLHRSCTCLLLVRGPLPRQPF